MPDEQGAARARPAPRVRQLLLGLLPLALLLAAAELILAALGVAPLIESQDPFRGFSGLVPVFEREGEVLATRAAATQTSFNDQSFAASKPPDGLRLFVLGGSSAYGFPWGHDAAFGAILGEALAAAHPERAVESVNAAGISYAMHRLNVVADELLAYEPDVFVVYSGHNEFIEPGFFDGLKARDPLRNQLEFWLAHTRSWSGLRSLFEQAPDSAAPLADFELDVKRDNVPTVTAAGKSAVVEDFGRHLERLVTRAQAAGVKLVLATVPANLRGWRPNASGEIAGLDAAARAAWGAAFAEGRRLLTAGDAAAARVELERAVELAPDHADSWYLLGQAHEALGRWDDARRAYGLACDADASPIRRVSAVNATIRAVGQRLGALVVDVDQVFEQESPHGLVGYELIEDYVHPTLAGHELIAWHLWDAMERAGWFGPPRPAERGLFDQLLARRSASPPPRNAAWFFNQGVVLQQQDRAAAAIERFEQALTLRPDYVAAMVNLAPLLAGRGQLAEALALLEQAVSVDPEFVEARNNLCALLPAAGRFEQALEHGRESLRLRPGQARVHAHLARALEGLGRLDEALAQHDRALELQPDHAETYNNRATLHARRGQSERALADFARALALRPGYPKAATNRGLLRAQLGQHDLALEDFGLALASAPDDSLARSTRGILLAQLGRYEQALADFSHVIERTPGDAEAWFQRGNTQAQRGELAQAIADLSVAIKLRPGHAQAWFNRGLAYDLSGRPERAAADLARARQLDPGL